MLQPDTLLQNRYRVAQQIGEGGMGAVYVATDERFGSTVALKETFFHDATMLRAFEREAKLLNRLRHPALPRVSDHFTEGEGQFLVMEFIAGEDLHAMLERRGEAFPAADVLRWADDLLDALDYLHTQEPQVLHRDIKPQNLKLTPRGQIILLDFGLAKGAPWQASSAATAASVFGYSRNYAPLEQIQGTGTDARSDLYSLAATLYHLATGHVPPDALTRAVAVLNHQDDPLRAADEVNPRVARSFAAVLARALSHRAADRPQTAAAMREELRRAAAEGPAATDSAAARTVFAPTLHTVSDASEHETKIFGAVERGAQPTVGGAGATVADDGAPRTAQGTPATAHVAARTDTPQGSGGTRGETTVVRPGAQAVRPGAHADVDGARGEATLVASTRRGRAGRVAAVAAGVLALCGATGAFVYTFTRRAPAPAEAPPAAQSAPAAAPQPAPTHAPQPAATHGGQQNPHPAPHADTPPAHGAATPAAAKAAPRRDNSRARADEGRERAAQGEPGEADAETLRRGSTWVMPPMPPGVVAPRIRIPPGVDWVSLPPEERRKLIDRWRRDAIRDQNRMQREMRRADPPRPAPTAPPTPRPTPPEP